MKRLIIPLAAAVLTASSALAQTAPAPTLTTTRYDEDWSKLPVRPDGPRWTDKFKHIDLNGDGDSYLVTGLELRARYEGFDNNLWGSAPAPDNGYVWLRALPYADLHVGHVRAFVQPIAGYAVGVAPAPGPVDQTRLDVLQSFADVRFDIGGNASLTLRGGRELVSLGSERLVGTRYTPNIPQAFDGGRAILTAGRLTANVLYVRPVDSRPGNFDDRTSRTKTLWGVYATRKLALGSGSGADLYYLGYRNDHAVYNQGVGAETRHTIGGRFFGKAANWRWNAEAIYQFGRFANGPISAWSVASEVTRSFAAVPLKPDLLMRLNVISGDRNPHNHTLGTFNALFPKGKYFGELSPVGPYNLINAHIGATVQLGHRVSSGVAASGYWRESLGDGVYGVPGNLIRAAGTARGRFIGKQVEATLAWQASPELQLSSSLSAFAPGDFIRETGLARTIMLLGLEASFRF